MPSHFYLDAYVFFPYFSKSAFTHHDTTKQTYLPAPCLTKLSLYIMCSSGILLLFHGFTFLLAFLRLLPGRLQQSKHLTMYRQHVLRKNNLLPYSKCLFSKQAHRLTFILLVVYFFISFAKLTIK